MTVDFDKSDLPDGDDLSKRQISAVHLCDENRGDRFVQRCSIHVSEEVGFSGLATTTIRLLTLWHLQATRSE